MRLLFVRLYDTGDDRMFRRLWRSKNARSDGDMEIIRRISIAAPINQSGSLVQNPQSLHDKKLHASLLCLTLLSKITVYEDVRIDFPQLHGVFLRFYAVPPFSSIIRPIMGAFHTQTSREVLDLFTSASLQVHALWMPSRLSRRQSSYQESAARRPGCGLTSSSSTLALPALFLALGELDGAKVFGLLSKLLSRCAVVTSTEAAEWYQENAPGISATAIF